MFHPSPINRFESDLMPLRALLVDDEPAARTLIREYLGTYPDIQVIGECGSGRQAVSMIHAERPDLVFLDIQMPGLNGFEVLEQLTFWPHIIFSTAFDTFALQAFETGAVDYLLKPYNRDRFNKAVMRVMRPHQLRQQDSDRLRSLIEAVQMPTVYLEQLFVRTGDRILPVRTDAIIWIEAAGDYSRLYTSDRTYLCNLGIGALEKKLDPARFARVHRSSIIAIPALTQLVSDGEGGFIATLQNQTKVRISRSYAPKVRKLIF